ncbi:MAG: ABC transporter permease subunit [Breznakia sp.]
MNNKRFTILRLAICVCLLMFVVIPLLQLLLTINDGDFQKVLSEPLFFTMLKDSLLTTTIATIISVSLALLLAWLLQRSGIRHKKMFALIFTLPMLIPSISHGMGLTLVFGDNGLFTNFLGINLHIYGYPGIIIGSVLYSFPVAFLMLSDAFQYEDFTHYEAARVLGFSKYQQFKVVTMTNIGSTLFSSIFAVFTMIFTDYGVALMVRGNVITLAVYMYREVIGLLNFSKGSVIGIMLLAPAVIAFIVDYKHTIGSNTNTVTKAYEIHKNKSRDRMAYGICATVSVLVMLPIASFVFLTIVKQYPINLSLSLDTIRESFSSLSLGNYVRNSLVIALLTGFFGVSLSYLAAYITARSKRTISTLMLHFIGIATLAIPGIVLGLSYVLLFNGSALQGTLVLIIIVNAVHFFASPYLLAYNSLRKYSNNLEDTAISLGISKWKMMMDVFIPSTQETIIEMFSYIFVNSMVTISAVSFLASFRNMPLSLLIPQLDTQSLIGPTAFVSVIILFINLCMKLFVSRAHKVVKYQKEKTYELNV